MPRLNTGEEFFKDLNSVSLFTAKATTPGDSTITVSVAAGDAGVTVASPVNFNDTDFVVISGSGGAELRRIAGAPVADVLTLNYALRTGQSVGARVLEMVEIPLGHIDESGVAVNTAQNQTQIKSATSRTPTATRNDAADLTFSCNLQGFNMENFALVFGLPDSAVSGTGTAADPWTTYIGGDTIGSATGLRVVRLTGSRFDGRIFELDILNATLKAPAGITFGGTSPAVLALSGSMTGLQPRIY